MPFRPGRRLRRLAHALGDSSRRWSGRAFVVLGLLVGLLVSIDLLHLEHPVGGLQDSLYDRLVRWRPASPAAEPTLLIIDIDERSLAQVGRDHGRWPWPRDVLAEALAWLAESGARAVFVNVLVTDPDPQRPDADRALQDVAAAYPQLVFPLLRLPQPNDRFSALDASRLPDVRPLPGASGDSDPVAVVLPAFAAMQQRMGASNLVPDADGILRSYPYWLPTHDHALPSAATATLLAAGIEPPPVDAPLRRLNWRNRQGSYERLSFAQLYAAMNGDTAALPAAQLQGRIVVLGGNAPGISVLRPTSQAPLTDDNLILATAIDDGWHGNGLRVLPREAILGVALLLLALLVALFLAGIDQRLLDRGFAATQVGLMTVIYLGISYTTWHVDLLLPVNAALVFYAGARGVQAVRQAALQGHAWFWDAAVVQGSRQVLVLVRPATAAARPAALVALRRQLESQLGTARVLSYEHLPAPEGYLGESMQGASVLLACLDGALDGALQAACDRLQAQGLRCTTLPVEGRDEPVMRRAVWEAVIRCL